MKKTPTIFALTAVLLTGLACGSGDTSETTSSKQTAPASTPASTDPSTPASTAPASTTPATPAFRLDPDAYLAALRRIDPDIVGKKDPSILVDRGRNQCDSISRYPDDEARLINLTNQRFTAPGHPDGFGEAKAKKILAVVREYICPDVQR